MRTPKGDVDDRVLELLNNEELLTKMTEAKSPQECYDMVKDTIDISFDEFQTSMAVAKCIMEESKDGLLTDEELDMVAGGKSEKAIDDTMLGISIAIPVVSAAAGAAAA